MSSILPFVGDHADESFTVNLEDEDYRFRFKWNTKYKYWNLHIGLTGQTAEKILKVTSNNDLLKGLHTYEGIPPGRLAMIDVSKEFGRCGRNNTGIDKRFELFYFRSDEDDQAVWL